MPLSYPDVRRDESAVDEYFGVQVPDPYRWLEDPDSEETKQFVDRQNAITRPYLEGCQYRDKIHERLKKMWDYPKYSCPYRHGDKYFFYKNSGLQNQSVLYVQDSLTSEPSVFLDPNLLSEDGTVSLSGTKFSEDGKVFAYGLSSSGSDWITIQFKKVEDGENYSEVLRKVKFSSITWTHDNLGIFYCMYPGSTGTEGSETESVECQKLFYHRLGTEQKEDVLVVEFPDHPKLRIGACVSDCGRYLIITTQEGCRDNLLYFCDLDKLGGAITGLLPLTQIVFKLEADYDYITNTGSKTVIRTNKDASNYRLIIIDLENPGTDQWTTLVPETADVLDWAGPVNNDKLIICYQHDVKNVLQYHNLEDGSHLHTFPLDVGTVTGFSGEKKYSEIFYQFASFLSPGIIYQCNLAESSLSATVFREITMDGFNREDYATKQVFYESKDGTKVPMFIIHRKDMQCNGTNPCLLYGYGGFNVSVQPTFSVTRILYLQNLRAVCAVANIRGGGEYGEKWHNSGRLLNKQNVFDDFHAAAEYLTREGYTNNKRLVIQGGSNGGLLVGACINQRPDLYAAAICQVGVLDMLKYHKFTIGFAWATDYGTSEDRENFHNLLKYSPLHNVAEPAGDGVQYPATLLLTADHDDRVVPLHSLKYIATLQHVLHTSPKQTQPLFIRVDTKAGHGGGKPTAKVIEEVADIICFIVQSLQVPVSL